MPAKDSSIVGAIPDWEFAGKTGNVEGITHECGLLYVRGRCMAVTVLSKGCADDEAREMIAQIGSEVYSYAQASVNKMKVPDADPSSSGFFY